MDALRVILAQQPEHEAPCSRRSFWTKHRAAALAERLPIDQAILGGFKADRLGYAFVAGYQAAVRALVPGLPGTEIVTICITERAGGHPGAIEARLEPNGDGRFSLTGEKRWATLAEDAGLLLVAAWLRDAEGHDALRVVCVDPAQPGVKRRPMVAPPFAPEVTHEEVDLAGVGVHQDDILPGDGFERYIRPFRTIEDIHVHAAVCAYAIREIRVHGLPRSLIERFAGALAALHALALADPSAPEAHLALAGVIELARGPFDELGREWQKTESPAHARWERDQLLLSVASRAREQRLERAWERLSEAGR